MEQVTTATTTTTAAATAAGTAPSPLAAAGSRIAARAANLLGRRSGLLLRGESAVASIGVALAAILLGAMASSAWWIAHTQSATTEGARSEQLHTVGDLTSQNVE